MNTIGDGLLTLRCRQCGSYWSRTLQEERYFAWAVLTARGPTAADMGIAVPRAGGSEKRGLPWRGRAPRRKAQDAS